MLKWISEMKKFDGLTFSIQIKLYSYSGVWVLDSASDAILLRAIFQYKNRTSTKTEYFLLGTLRSVWVTGHSGLFWCRALSDLYLHGPFGPSMALWATLRQMWTSREPRPWSGPSHFSPTLCWHALYVGRLLRHMIVSMIRESFDRCRSLLCQSPVGDRLLSQPMMTIILAVWLYTTLSRKPAMV